MSICCQVTSVVSNSVRPHRWQPTRLPCPWDSPGKDTGVGCHFLLQQMKVKRESEVTQLCLTLSDPMDCSLPGSSVHAIFQARALEWGAIAFSEYIPRQIEYIPQQMNIYHGKLSNLSKVILFLAGRSTFPEGKECFILGCRCCGCLL